MTSAGFHTDAGDVPLSGRRPLLAVDADEVVLRFASGFDRFLEARGCYLDLSSYRLHGNVRSRVDNLPLLDVEVTTLLDEFRAELDWLEPVAGAREALHALKDALDIVVISNVTPLQAPARVRNLAALGLSFPLVANAGPKGPAVKALAQAARGPAFFVDDIPAHHSSVAEFAPSTIRIHFVGDERLKPLLPPAPHAHLKAESWSEIAAFVLKTLERDGE